MKIFKVLLLISLAGSLTSLTYGQTPSSYVQIEGKFKHNKSEIKIEQKVLNITTDEYEVENIYYSNRHYILLLDPEKDYEIGFHSNTGSKYLVHKGGLPGRFEGKCDIDFNWYSSMYIYQINGETYGSQIVKENPTLLSKN